MRPKGIDKIFEVIQPEEFSQRVQTGNNIIDFYANWCAPCNKIIRDYEPVKEFADSQNISLLAIDVDALAYSLKNKSVSLPFNVTSIPTLVGYSNGNLITLKDNSKAIMVGVESSETFISRIKQWYDI